MTLKAYKGHISKGGESSVFAYQTFSFPKRMDVYFQNARNNKKGYTYTERTIGAPAYWDLRVRALLGRGMNTYILKNKLRYNVRFNWSVAGEKQF